MSRFTLFFVIVPPIAFALIMYDTAGPPWDALRISGLVLAAIGVALLSLARFQLGNAFSITPQARMLVTRGLYRRIRHPVYVFGGLAIVGLILYLRRPIFLLVFLVVTPLQVLRAQKEERVLEDKFGEEYRRYRESTWL